MAYREHRFDAQPKAKLWYGPFLPRGKDWAILLGLAFFTLVLLEAGLGARGIVCERGECKWIRDSVLFGRRVRSFAARDVIEVRFVTGLGKNRGEAESVLVFRSGTELRIGRDSEDDARETHERLSHVLREPEADLDLVSRGYGFLAVLAGLLTVGFATQLLRMLGIARPWGVSVWPERVLLRRWPIGDSREIEIGEPRRVVTDDGPVTIEHARGKSALPPGPRSGGFAARRTARKLASALGVPEPELPARAARRPWPRRPISHGVVWFCVLTTVTVAVIRNCTSYMKKDEGTLVLECQTRCRFQGMECLPGGSLQMALPPGTHGIEVWDPDAPTHWKTKKFSIEIGETTHFVCARSP